MNKYLTVGKPSTVLWKFCLPLFASIIFQQLYNIADSVVAGRFINEKALAAVGNSYEITLIYLAFAVGCNIGCSVIASLYFGAKEYSKLKSAVSTSMIATGSICIVLMTVGIIFSGDFLYLINTSSEIYANSKIYLDIYTWGLPFVFFYNLATGIFSALGDSKTPFIFLLCSSISNVLMDILFVTAFDLKVAGVAWATFMCQGISCILALIFVFMRLSKIKTEGKFKLFSIPLFKQFLSVSIPSTLQQCFVSIGNIVLQSLINTYSTGVIAGYAAGVKFNNMVITSYTAVGNGLANYTAQNLGAQKFDRIHEGFKAGIKMILLITIPIALTYFFAGKWLLYLFLENPTADALSTGELYMKILAPFYFAVACKIVGDGVQRGSKQMGKYMISTFTDLLLRVGLAYVLSSTVLGSVGIWCAWPIGWLTSTIMSVIFTKTINYKKIKL